MIVEKRNNFELLLLLVQGTKKLKQTCAGADI